jgi:hypothetical protein
VRIHKQKRNISKGAKILIASRPTVTILLVHHRKSFPSWISRSKHRKHRKHQQTNLLSNYSRTMGKWKSLSKQTFEWFCRLVAHPNSKSICYVKFESTDAAIKALANLHGSEINGRIIHLMFAKYNFWVSINNYYENEKKLFNTGLEHVTGISCSRLLSGISLRLYCYMECSDTYVP